MSDLHLEFFNLDLTDVPADVLVLAGDISIGHEGLRWARARLPRIPIIYVMGNHEYYNGQYECVLDEARAAAARLGVHLLEREEVRLDGVRFLGTTLWTDFEIEEPALPRAIAYQYANRSMNDFRTIRYGDRMLRAQDTRELHIESRTWLANRLAESFGGRTVVVTHHLPHRLSINPRFARDPLNPAFASHLPELVRAPVALWLHGHTHCSCDYTTDAETRVLCNPRGYGPADLNEAFDSQLVVEV